MDLIAPLRVPWHPTKTGLRFAYTMVFIGFFWDLIDRRVSLPDPKRLKFLMRVQLMLNKIEQSLGLSLLELQKIHGSLVHICFVYQEGSSHLPLVSNFMAKFNGNEFIRRRGSSSLSHTLTWWKKLLSLPDYFRQLRPLGEVVDMDIYVDASMSWGIGIIIGQRWAAFRLAPDWKRPGRDICWLEAIALKLLVYFLVQLDISEIRLLIHSDNKGAIGALEKGRSPNEALNLCVRRTYAVLADHLIVPELEYIESARNPSDPLSRGELGPVSYQRLERSFELPWELSDIFVDSHG
jgi:hypothetical protein